MIEIAKILNCNTNFVWRQRLYNSESFTNQVIRQTSPTRCSHYPLVIQIVVTGELRGYLSFRNGQQAVNDVLNYDARPGYWYEE